MASPALALWLSCGEPISAEIKPNEQGNIIEARGPLQVSALNQWLKRPELNYAQGRAEVTSQIQLPSFKGGGDRALKLEFTSDLRGVAFQAPPPLGKTASEALSFKGLMRLDKTNQEDTYQFSIGPRRTSTCAAGPVNSTPSACACSMPARAPLQSGQTLVDIAYPDARLADWQDFTLGYVALLTLASPQAPAPVAQRKTRRSAHPSPESNPAAAPAEASLPVDLQLKLSSLQAGSLALTPVSAHLTQEAANWQLRFDTPSAQGTLTYRANSPNAPWLLQLAELNLPESASRKDDGKCTPTTPPAITLMPPSSSAKFNRRACPLPRST